jgi:hypothetical protein
MTDPPSIPGTTLNTELSFGRAGAAEPRTPFIFL